MGVSLWSVWPMVTRWDRVADYGKDGMLIAAIQMNWHQKITDYIRHKTDSKMGLFDGYYFYAEKNSLAYTDMLFISSLMTYWPARLSNNLAMGAGLTLVVGQALMMIVSYAMFAKMSKSIWGAVIGSIVFGLSQIHFMYQVHLQVWNMSYWLLGYWLFSRKQYLISGALLGLQMWESPLGVYFGLAAIITYLIFNFKFLIFKQYQIFNFLIFIITFGLVAFWPAKAYWEVSNYYHYVRTIRDAAYHSLSLNSLEGFISPGLFLLFTVSLLRIFNFKFKSLNQFQISNFKFQIILIITAYILALGPVLKWDNKTVKIGGVIPVPLPYTAAYYLVPGWQAFRVPSRFLVITGWGMAGVIAIMIGKLQITNHKSQTFGLVGCLAVAILGGTHITKYIDLPRVIPKEYLVNEEVLTFKPMGGEPEEIERMYFSILAGKKTMNGFSGFLPPERVRFLMEK